MKPRTAITLLVTTLITAFILLAGCGDDERVSEPFAVVNGESITFETYHKRLGLLNLGFAGVTGFKSVVQDTRITAAGQIIEEALLLQEARRLNISTDEAEVGRRLENLVSGYPDGEFAEALGKAGITMEDFRDSIARQLTIETLVRSEVVARIKVTDEEARSYYEEHKAEFGRPESVRARQIVVDSEIKAEEVLDRIRSGEDFARVAGEVSLSPDGAQGGDLGYFSHGEMPPEFEEVVFRMKPGETSEVTRTPYGYHIFELLDRRKEQSPSFEEARAEVAAKVRLEKSGPAYAAWRDDLRAKASVELAKEFMGRP